jgi:nucleoside-diphosphate-sugar epimerase
VGRSSNAGARVRICDVTDFSQVRSLIRDIRPDVVFHLASSVTGSRNIDLVLPTLNSTLLGTVNVLLAATESEARVICLGSLQEPDDQIRGTPPSPYAAAKFAAGAYARLFASVYSAKVDIARPFMVYGPGQLDLTKLVPYILSRLLRGEAAELSSGRQPFDWIHVDDVVAALLATATRGAGDGTTVDIGSGSLTSVREIAERLARSIGAEHLLKFGALEDRRLEPTRSANLQETESRIGWKPRIDLDTGLSRTVDWYRDYFA